MMKVLVAVALCTLAVVTARPDNGSSTDVDAALKLLDATTKGILSAFSDARQLVHDQLQASQDHTDDASTQLRQKWVDDLSELRQKAQEAGLNVDACLTEDELKQWSDRVAFAMNLMTSKCLAHDFYFMIFDLHEYENVAWRAKTSMMGVNQMLMNNRPKDVVDYALGTIRYLNQLKNAQEKGVNMYLAEASNKLAHCRDRGIVDLEQVYDEERKGLEDCIASLTLEKNMTR